MIAKVQEKLISTIIISFVLLLIGQWILALILWGKFIFYDVPHINAEYESQKRAKKDLEDCSKNRYNRKM